MVWVVPGVSHRRMYRWVVYMWMAELVNLRQRMVPSFHVTRKPLENRNFSVDSLPSYDFLPGMACDALHHDVRSAIKVVLFNFARRELGSSSLRLLCKIERNHQHERSI